MKRNTLKYVAKKSQSLKIAFILANSTDSDEMPPYATFHLGLHCLPKYLFTGIQNEKDKLALGVEIPCLTCPTWPHFIQDKLKLLFTCSGMSMKKIHVTLFLQSSSDKEKRYFKQLL